MSGYRAVGTLEKDINVLIHCPCEHVSEAPVYSCPAADSAQGSGNGFAQVKYRNGAALQLSPPGAPTLYPTLCLGETELAHYDSCHE